MNCAGGDIGAAGGKPVPNNALDIPLEDVRALTNNNLIGTITVCKAFIPPMREKEQGVVVNEARFINGQVLCVDGGLVNFPAR